MTDISALPTETVGFADNMSATRLLHEVLVKACERFPQVFAGVALPRSEKAFRAAYPELMPRFEAARLDSECRLAVAQHCVEALDAHVCWRGEDASESLASLLSRPGTAPPLEQHQFAASSRWTPGMVYRGKRYAGDALAVLGADLVARGLVSEPVGAALTWLCEHALEDGRLDLAGRKIVMLGAGAEMAPTRFWLEAGADVLWLDTRPPPADWWQRGDLSGRLFWPAQPIDLLVDPQAIVACLADFAGDHALDLGLYAYAGGQARELRLTAVMNAIVDALPPASVASVTMLISPTTPTALPPADTEFTRARLASRPKWQSALGALGLLGRGQGFVTEGDSAVSRTVVDIQGASYQAAQYFAKILAAEVWASGVRNGTPLRVSANTAAITKTRSLDHPVFAAAFGGAIAFGVETLVPRQSQCLNGLLAVHDWLHPELPQPGRLRVHGGIHTLHYPLASALRIAAGIGFARSPRLLRGLFGR